MMTICYISQTDLLKKVYTIKKMKKSKKTCKITYKKIF